MLGPALPASVLARRAALPAKPAPVTLHGSIVHLRPLDLDRDVERLQAVSSGRAIRVGARTCEAYDPEEAIWRYMYDGPFADEAALRAHLAVQVGAPDGLALSVLDAATGHPVGVANYLANRPEHLKIELGSIWYGPVAQGTGANREATYMMLDHAFTLGYQRVEWKCNALNQRSRHAALQMGFHYEGTQDAHVIVRDRRRDTAWFRILADEWPSVRGAAVRRGAMPERAGVE